MGNRSGFAEFEIYRDSKGEFRWRFRARNGRLMADGAEGYKTRRGATSALARFRELAAIEPAIIRLTA